MHEQIWHISPPFLNSNSGVLFTWVLTSGSVISDTSFGARTLNLVDTILYLAAEVPVPFSGWIQHLVPLASRFWYTHQALHVVSSKPFSWVWGKEGATSAPLCTFSPKIFLSNCVTLQSLKAFISLTRLKGLEREVKNCILGVILLLCKFATWMPVS